MVFSRVRTAAALDLALREMIMDDPLIEAACAENPWFTKPFIEYAGSVVLPWLQADAVKRWLSRYPRLGETVDTEIPAPSVGLIFAGNIPFAGFHDLLCVLMSGARPWVKFSPRDEMLMRELIVRMERICPEMKGWVMRDAWTSSPDLLVATGSDNTARYTEYEFRDTVKVIRKNRYSVAVLDGSETETDLALLGWDILLYNGMGCRNVSQVLVPQDFDTERLAAGCDAFPRSWLNPQWETMLRYERAALQTTGEQFAGGKTVLLKESDRLSPVPPGYVQVVRYAGAKDARQRLLDSEDRIQCIAGKGHVAFGGTQSPEVEEYADGVDVLGWILRNGNFSGPGGG